jgi:hypothetical protein
VIPGAAGGMNDDAFDDGGDGDATAANEQANRAIIASLVANFIIICAAIELTTIVEKRSKRPNFMDDALLAYFCIESRRSPKINPLKSDK